LQLFAQVGGDDVSLDKRVAEYGDTRVSARLKRIIASGLNSSIGTTFWSAPAGLVSRIGAAAGVSVAMFHSSSFASGSERVSRSALRVAESITFIAAASLRKVVSKYWSASSSSGDSSCLMMSARIFVRLKVSDPSLNLGSCDSPAIAAITRMVVRNEYDV